MDACISLGLRIPKGRDWSCCCCYFLRAEHGKFCFIPDGECSPLVKEKMAKYGIDTSKLQCISQMRGNEMTISLWFQFTPFLFYFIAKLTRSAHFFLVHSPPLLLCCRVRLDGKGARSRTKLSRLSHMKTLNQSLTRNMDTWPKSMISLALENVLFMLLIGFLFASALFLVSKIWESVFGMQNTVLWLSLCQ